MAVEVSAPPHCVSVVLAIDGQIDISATLWQVKQTADQPRDHVALRH